jgi:hypothetical protein
MQYLKVLLISLLFVTGSVPEQSDWLRRQTPHFTVFYQRSSEPDIALFEHWLEKGYATTETFFTDTFKSSFDVYVHPGRATLDSTWQRNWKQPSFRSECWMVASGEAGRLDLLSPRLWNTQACGHRFEDTVEAKKLITHEMVHVFHAQHQSTPDFSDAVRIDWFVEGLATYASGQLSRLRIRQIQNSIRNKTVPRSLDKFWTGPMRYGLSGSVVAYIDQHYGRKKLKQLLSLSTQ